MIKSRLKDVLARHNMSQVQLARITGIRQPTISALCVDKEGFRMKRLPVDVIEKLCAALDCQPGDLMEYIPDAKTPQE